MLLWTLTLLCLLAALVIALSALRIAKIRREMASRASALDYWTGLLFDRLEDGTWSGGAPAGTPASAVFTGTSNITLVAGLSVLDPVVFSGSS